MALNNFKCNRLIPLRFKGLRGFKQLLHWNVTIFVLLPLKSFSARGVLYLGMSVCESVHPKNLVNTISQQPMKEFDSFLLTDAFRFRGVLIRFLGLRSKFKVTAGSDPKSQVNTISL